MKMSFDHTFSTIRISPRSCLLEPIRTVKLGLNLFIVIIPSNLKTSATCLSDQIHRCPFVVRIVFVYNYMKAIDKSGCLRHPASMDILLPARTITLCLS